MTHSRFRAGTIACALLASTAPFALATPALAQSATTALPVRQFKDGNGVDLLSGTFTASSPGILIGDQETGLSFARDIRSAYAMDSMLGFITSSGSTYTVSIGSRSEQFTLSGGVYTPVEQNGSTLTYSGGQYTYRGADGTVAIYGNNSTVFGNAYGIVLNSLTYPSGKTLTFSFTTGRLITAQTPNGPAYAYGTRLASVQSNTGYKVYFAYEIDTNPLSNGNDVGRWQNVVRVTGVNSLLDGCGSVTACTASATRPTMTVSNWASQASRDYIDNLGNVTHFDFSSDGITGIKLPGSSTANISVAYTSGKVSSVTAASVTTTYAFVDSGTTRTTTVTRGGASSIYTFDTSKLLLLSSQDQLGHVTSYQYDTNNRPTRVTAPEGNYVGYTYDPRGNVTETRRVAKAGSGLADIVTTASYDSTCSVAVKCNSPNSTTDARGNTTDYTYDTTHGGVLTVTSPAPTAGAVRPQVRNSYTRLDASGAASASGVFKLTGTSVCRTTASCTGTADEVKTTTAYGQNQNVSSVTTAAGDNSLSATTAYTYDLPDNQLTVDGPLAGTADTTRYRYDADRRVIGTVSPDPDGAGALKDQATRITYRPDGQVSKKEAGTVTDQSDAAWSAFSVAQTVDIGFDTYFRPITSKLSAGGTDYALTQTSYDALGRANCVAVRMNPAVYGSLPSDACTLGTAGSFGPDRITKTIFDNADEVTQIQVAVGTSDAANERTLTYTNNGKLQTLVDGENNKTTYVYDGFDRLSQTQFPSATKGAGTSNSSDYEQLSYDAASNVTSRRVRSGGLINYGYDNLNRRTALSSSLLADRAYTYDLLNHPLTATFTTGGQGITNSYGALGRLASSSSNVGGTSHALSYQYDLAGRRTQLTWWDGFYVNYDRLVTGALSKVRANGATSGAGVLATYAYDDLGRTTSLTRGDGTVTTYGFDAVSRLTSLTHDLAGTSYDLTIGTMTYNPVGQILATPRSNDAYAWTGHYNVNRGYTSNGLNQYTAAGPASFAYDTNGNLTGDSTSTFIYDIENKLTNVTRTGFGATLSYDPLNRLDLYNPGTATRFIYDGSEVVAQLDASGNIVRRQVRGDGADQVLVEYNTSDWRYFHTDERGSTIGWSDPAGNAASILTYDEYGTPASSNPGFFQYTGQMWLPEIGIYNYKARMYSPTLGRFLQTDPIGYGDGPNWYAYVHSDPVNGTDPTGMTQPTPEQIAQFIEQKKLEAMLNGMRNSEAMYSAGDLMRTLSNATYEMQTMNSLMSNPDVAGRWQCTNCDQHGSATTDSNGNPVITGVRPHYAWVSGNTNVTGTLTGIQIASGIDPQGTRNGRTFRPTITPPSPPTTCPAGTHGTRAGCQSNQQDKEDFNYILSCGGSTVGSGFLWAGAETVVLAGAAAAATAVAVAECNR
jgi:RHS repeat-associated protein